MQNNDGIFKQLPEIRKNGSLYECIRELIDKTLSDNLNAFNDFTVEHNISVLPDSRYYIGGKRIEKEEILKCLISI